MPGGSEDWSSQWPSCFAGLRLQILHNWELPGANISGRETQGCKQHGASMTNRRSGAPPSSLGLGPRGAKRPSFMSATHLWPEEHRQIDGSIRLSVRIEKPGGNSQILWWSFPEAFGSLLTRSCDPLLVGAIYLLMRDGHDVKVHGQVSPSLLRGLEDYQAAWAYWIPGLTQVDIVADEEEEEISERAPRESAVSVFSGGVDSSFTAFRHSRRQCVRFPQPLEAGLMIRGLDIPVDQVGTFNSAADRAERLLVSLGLDLIRMATNYVELASLDGWASSYGAFLASCMMLLLKRFSTGLIAQGPAYAHLRHLNQGSNPLTDALLSTSAFKVVPDGAAYQRIDKVKAMSGWEELRNDLRVCWQGPRKDRNCCVCEKCVRTILTFRVLDLGLPPCFEKDVSDKQIMALRSLREPVMNSEYQPVLELARQKGLHESWVKALERRLWLNQKLRTSRLFYHGSRLPYYARRAGARILGLATGKRG